MRINAAVVRPKNGPFTIEELDLENPRDDEVLVRIVASGICHTDLSIRDQMLPAPLPMVLGHEGAGIVEKIGRNVTKVAPGDHVVLSYMTCGRCRNCTTGLPSCCDAIFPLNFGGTRSDGSSWLKTAGGAHSDVHSFFSQSSFATRALANERNVVKVATDVPLRILGPLGCGIQTGAGTVITALRPPAGSAIAVFGTGSVGLSSIMAARVVGCTTIIGLDINEQRLELARDLGATHVINCNLEDPVEAIRGITRGGADYSIDSTGVSRITRQAVECLRIPGTCGLIGGAPLGTEVTFTWESLFFGRTVRGIVEGDAIAELFIPQMIDLYRDGRFPFDRLIRFYPLTDINRAAADAQQGLVLKPVLVPE
jgi:aryl-alcohol dehydrogenase